MLNYCRIEVGSFLHNLAMTEKSDSIAFLPYGRLFLFTPRFKPLKILFSAVGSVPKPFTSIFQIFTGLRYIAICGQIFLRKVLIVSSGVKLFLMLSKCFVRFIQTCLKRIFSNSSIHHYKTFLTAPVPIEAQN